MTLSFQTQAVLKNASKESHPGSELLHDAELLEEHGARLGVGLDAADVVGLRRVQGLHQEAQLGLQTHGTPQIKRTGVQSQ